ncbi:hypothetical protein, partial [Frankia nepalensis]|uniref:hypothetical protein n=1 Tax=Frankia nepalensis TaxID=1836974 RepID=UPI001EE4B892
MDHRLPAAIGLVAVPEEGLHQQAGARVADHTIPIDGFAADHTPIDGFAADHTPIDGFAADHTPIDGF